MSRSRWGGVLCWLGLLLALGCTGPTEPGAAAVDVVPGDVGAAADGVSAADGDGGEDAADLDVGVADVDADAAKPDTDTDAAGADAVELDAETTDGVVDGDVDGSDIIEDVDLVDDGGAVEVDGDGGLDLDGSGDAASDGDIVDAADGEADSDATDAAGLLSWAQLAAKCDAGDEAFARRALATVAGRKPRGVAELRVLKELTKVVGRKQMVAVLLSLPEARTRWSGWLQDELRVSRAGYRQHKQCFAAPALPGPVDGKLCTWVRDHGAGSEFGKAWTMNDLLASCLVLDDLSPVYRAYLFAMLARPTTQCCNPTIAELDQLIRSDFGRIVRETYLHKDVACVGCHNSQYAVTDDVDPQLDRHWPIPGLFEKAIFGASAVASSAALDPPFRYFGVATGGFCVSQSVCSVLKGVLQQPWGMSTECGTFLGPNAVAADPFGTPAFFAKSLGTDASIWQVEALLAAGMKTLRTQGKVIVDPVTLEIESEQAFAYQWAIRVAHQAWAQVIGQPLTLTHGFSRNAEQLQILEGLAETFVASGFSLRALLEAILTHPLFNLAAPQAGCAASAYPFGPVLDAFAVEAEEPDKQGNGPGDRVRRYSPRVVLAMVEHALGWPETPAFGSYLDAEFQSAIGMFMEENVPGFRGVDFGAMLRWEDRLGVCEQPPRLPVGPGSMSALNSHSCVNRCNNNDTVEGPSCGCTLTCKLMDNCCADYDKVCAGADVPLPKQSDWIDGLLALAVADPKTSVRDVATALKDRLLAQPDWTPAEEAAVAAFFGVAQLDVKASQVSNLPKKARHFCGVLLKTPHFSLDGPTPEAQLQSPALVAKEDTLLAICQQWASLPAVQSVVAVQCAAGSVTVVPTP